MRSSRLSLALLAATATVGMAGCVSQPWQLPDPYGYGSGAAGASSPYSYGGAYGYGAPYGYSRYSDPYYYRQTYVLPYAAYGYIPYPGYAGHYCRDNDRDGRCDNREYQDHDDRDHDRDHDHDHDRDHHGDADQGGSQPRLGSDPLDVVRRIARERERERTTTAVAPSAVIVPSRTVAPAGAAPTLRTPAPPAPRAEPRRSEEVTAPTRRGPRGDDARDARKGPRDDDTVVRRPLR